jgi:endonuclease/exonuclease/phosphatase (EEP) superfamily protein YafD
VLLCSLSAWLPVDHWLTELFVHFRVQYFVLGLMFLALFLWMKSKTFVWLSITVCLMNVMVLFDVLPFIPREYVDPDNQRLKLFHANVLTSNQQHQHLVDQVLAAEVDVVVLQEVNQRWLDQLVRLNDRFEYRIAVPRSDNFGMLLLSRFPINKQQVHQWSLFELPNIEAELNVEGRAVTVLAVHPPPPVNRRFFEARNEHFKQVTQRVNQANTPVVVVGDLNTSQWSTGYRSMVADTGLVNASKGRGFLPTWPTNLWPLMIPIDHCLVTEDVVIQDVYTGKSFGSDHLPLLVELGF